MKGEMDKSLFFLLLSFACIWLVLDVAVGGDRLGNFLESIFPFMKGTANSSIGMTAEEVEEAKEKAPSSSAIGSDGFSGKSGSFDSGTGINTVPYGATRPGVS